MWPELAGTDLKFRNADGVGGKTYHIATLHPDYSGNLLRGRVTQCRWLSFPR
jgi:hypothetical protein